MERNLRSRFLAPLVSCLLLSGGGAQIVWAEADPGTPGPRVVTVQEYTFGDEAFQPTDWVPLPGSPRVELTASVHAPTDLTDGPFPLVVLLHGRHATCFEGSSAFLQWPCPPPRQSIPSYRGYDYLAGNLASHGYIVVSISANGINARDNSVFDLGMLARGQLIQRHLEIWRMFNTTGGPPVGTRFVGKVDLQNIGTMGHSRGGEGVVRHFVLNAAQGSPFGIKAVFPLAPVDFSRPVINRVPLGVLLPYCDGDVADLQGVHFYDDARYNVPGDSAPKHTLLVMGANHNFYNTIWTPGLFPAGAADDWLAFVGGGSFDPHCGAGPGNQRLSPAQQRGTGLAYMSAFFRTYLGRESSFFPLLTGDAPPPPSAMTDQLHVSYHAGDTPESRRDVNRLLSATNLTTNTLGGAVTQTGLVTYNLCGGEAPQPRFCLPLQANARQPHTAPSARDPNHRGLSQLQAAWEDSSAVYQNDLPSSTGDVSSYFALQFRAGVNYGDFHNVSDQDFSVTLMDGAGNAATTAVGNWSEALFYPPGKIAAVPKAFLNTVRIPLAAFDGVNLTDVRSVQFRFNGRDQGALLISDLAFSDPADFLAGPAVASTTPSGILVGPVSSLLVAFNVPIDVPTFTAEDISFAGPAGSIPVTGVSVVPGSGNSRFEVTFPPQGTAGFYTMVIGPNILDRFGNAMDQNFNRLPGEIPGDQFTATFGVVGPFVVDSTPRGNLVGTVGSTRVTFSATMDPVTFTADDIVSFIGPGGSVPVTGVDPVAGTGDTQFDITYPVQSADGSYTMVIGPDIRDVFGNQMDQNGNLVPGEVPGDRFATGFNLNCTGLDGFGYQACTASAESIDLEPGQPGVFTIITAADDASVPVNLGTNTFNFYGTAHTGTNRLFVSSNGLITFGSANNEFFNQNLTTDPPQAAISPLWDDWWKENGTPANPMILGRFDGNRLIIEWNQVFHFDSSRTNAATFQAILQLNTGTASGGITFNYPDLEVSDPGLNNGGSATVGIKDLGAQGPRRVLVSFNNGSDPFVQGGRALRINRP